MYSKNKYLSFLCIAFLFACCSHPKPSKQDIIGVWKSVDEAIIEIKEDSSVKIRNYPLTIVHSDLSGFFNGTGDWEILKKKVHLHGGLLI